MLIISTLLIYIHRGGLWHSLQVCNVKWHRLFWLGSFEDNNNNITVIPKCDYRTDAGQSDPYMPLCFAGDTIAKIKVCLWNTMPPAATGIFSTKVKVKKYEASISYGSKVIANVKVDNRQTDRTKTICPQSFDPGHNKNMTWWPWYSFRRC